MDFSFSYKYRLTPLYLHNNLMITRPTRLWAHLHNVLSTCTRLGFPKRKLLLHFFSFDLAKILSDTVHGLFPQHQCCKHTIWENTDQCCPYGNSTPGHSAMKMSLFQSSLPLWLLAYLRKFLRYISSLSAFQFTAKKLYFKWFAMTGKTCFSSATLKSAQNFRPEKTFCRRWVVNCGRCVVSWLLRSSLDIKKSGYKPWLGTLLCSGTQHFTLTVPLSLPRCINRIT